jgi:FtsH Extracellular.
MKRLQRWILPIALGLAGLILLTQYLTSGTQPGQWSYSELVTNAQAGKVSEIMISGVSGVATDTSGHKYNVALPSDQTVTLADELRADGVKVSFASGTDLGTLLITFLPN